MSKDTNRVNQKPKTEEGEPIQWPKDNKTNDTNRVNQKPKTEEGETIQWPKDNPVGIFRHFLHSQLHQI
jgi:NADH:ubiquinone oxidoreductase subunit